MVRPRNQATTLQRGQAGTTPTTAPTRFSDLGLHHHEHTRLRSIVLPRSAILRRIALAAGALGLLTGVALAQTATATPTPVTSPAPSTASTSTTDLKPYTEKLSGTAVEFQMVPVPVGTAADGTPIQPFYIAKIETTWDLYDVMIFGLDSADGSPPPSVQPLDAITKPTKPYLTADRGWGHAGFAGISIAPKAANAFCAWLIRQDR